MDISKFSDMLGKKYGKITINKIYKSKGKKGGRTLCDIICDCGNKENGVYLPMIKAGQYRSCNCSMFSAPTKDPIYKKFIKSYYTAKQRCNNPNDNNYKRYGARGVKCRRENAQSFYNDMYDSYKDYVSINGQKDCTLDRIDGYGDYCKENCRWIGIKEQNNNRMSYGNRYYKISDDDIKNYIRKKSEIKIKISEIKKKV